MLVDSLSEGMQLRRRSRLYLVVGIVLTLQPHVMVLWANVLIVVSSPVHWKCHEDAVFRGMLTHGYDWTIIRHSATQRIPRLPHFLQQALNATNSAAAEQSELEVLA